MKITKIIAARFDDNAQKQLSKSELTLLYAWITSTCAPSNDDEDIIKAIIAYGDTRVAERMV